MTDKISNLERRFDKHLAIYAANGKESKRVADLIEKMMEHSRERDIKLDEMYESFTTGREGIRILKWVFGLSIAVGGAYLMIKQIIHA
jgi:hypothetical protein